MNFPRNFSDEAIVLRRHNYGEADRLLTVFTKNHGKLFAIAKGVRKSTSKKSAHIELFTHTKLYFASSHNFLIITQAETVNSFPLLKADLTPIRAAFHLNEVIDKLFFEHEPYPELFSGLVDLFSILNQGASLTDHQRHQHITRFQLDLLTQLGFGLPESHSPTSVYAFIEEILDFRLKAAKSLI